MSIAEYQLYLKKIIDNTNDESLLKRWKAQLDADVQDRNEKQPGATNASSLTEPAQEAKPDQKDDKSGYVVVELGLGIDE